MHFLACVQWLVESPHNFQLTKAPKAHSRLLHPKTLLCCGSDLQPACVCVCVCVCVSVPVFVYMCVCVWAGHHIKEGKGQLKSWTLCDGLREGVMGQGLAALTAPQPRLVLQYDGRMSQRNGRTI